MTYRLQGDYPRAVADFDRAIELNPKNDWWLYQRAITRRVWGREAEAAKELCVATEMAKAIETKSPNDWQNRLNLGLYRLATGENDAANVIYRAAINAKIPSESVQDALQDLDEYLHLFPLEETASMIREQLQEYIKQYVVGR